MRIMQSAGSHKLRIIIQDVSISNNIDPTG